MVARDKYPCRLTNQQFGETNSLPGASAMSIWLQRGPLLVQQRTMLWDLTFPINWSNMYTFKPHFCYY
jgi:isopentenyldiphosphate isomerase